MAAQLTPGAVAVMSDHADGTGTLQPVLQVVDVRIVNNTKGPSNERFRMLLSDGAHTMQSMLATAENALVRDGYIKKGSIIHLHEFTCSTIQSRRIIIVIKLDVLQTECDIIGNPRSYELRNQPNEQGTNIPANAPQPNTGTYSSGPGMLGSSAAPSPAPVASNVPYGGSYEMRNQPNEQGTNLPANAAQANTGTYSSGPGMPVSSAAPSPAQVTSNLPYGGSYEMRNQPNEQGPNLLANGAQANIGTYSSGTGMLGSSAAPRPVQVADNVPYGGSYGGFRGTVGSPVGRAVESVPNVASGVSCGTTSAHNNAMNVGMMQSTLQQPSLNTHQNQRFAVPFMAGGSGAPGNTYGQPAHSFYQQPPPGHMNRAPASKNDASRIIPVAQLNPYQTYGSTTIKVRVTAKADIRHYRNHTGPGKVFSFDVLDGQGGEIRVTCFNAEVDQFFDLIEVDKVYLISKGSVRAVKPEQKKFNSLNHEYQMILESKSSIEVCVDDDSNIPRQQYNFRQISEIENIQVNAIVDLIGVVTSVGPSSTLNRKDGSETLRRTLQLKDMSGRSIEITFWQKFCDAEGLQLQLQCDSGLNPILALKGARVTDFSGRSLSTTGSTQIKINPDFPEAETLWRWYATEGKTAACVSLSGRLNMGRTDVRKSVAQIKDEDLGRSEKPDFITVKGAISHLTTDNFCYPACTVEVNGRPCHKKVINNGDGTWHCDRCDQSSQNCEYRYLLQCQIQDHTGFTYATAFQEAGFEMIGHSAHDLYNMRDEDQDQFAEIIQAVRWQQFLFKLKVKEETYNDEQRVKCNILKAEKLDTAKESSYLLGVINGLLQDDTCSPSEVQGSMAYNAGISNTGVGLSMPTANSAYTTNMSGPRYGESANQIVQHGNMYFGAPTPAAAPGNVQTCMSCGSSGHNTQNCPKAGMYRQQPAASTTSSYASSQPHNIGLTCLKCNKTGHMAASCPLQLQPQPQQPYRSSGGASLGGYGKPQPYVGATNY